MAARSEQPLVEAYGDGGFRISGADHSGSVLLLPDAVVAWPVATAADVAAAQFEPLLARSGSIDILLLGCGPRMEAIAADVRATLREGGIAVEAMDTGAACRAFNLLANEGRRVAAALIAV